jgi:hypothetical protein
MNDCDGGRVDITKLTYSCDYKSYLNRRDSPTNYLQYARFAAIIAILESIMLDSLKHKSSSWLIGSSVCVLLAVTLGKQAVGGHLRSLVLFLLATLASVAVHYAAN